MPQAKRSTTLHTPPIKPPTSYQKQLISMLSSHLTQLSCDQEEFEKAAPDYEEAMLKSGFAGELEYVKISGSAKRSRKETSCGFTNYLATISKLNEFLKRLLYTSHSSSPAIKHATRTSK